MEYDETIREQLSAYLDGELSEAENQRVEAAVAADAQLAEELRQLRATRALLGALPPQKLDAAFTTKVMQRIADGSAASEAASPAGRGMRIFAAAAVVVALVGVGLVAVWREYEKTSGTGDTPQIAATTEPEKRGEIARGDLKKHSYDAKADKLEAKAPESAAETFADKAPTIVAAKPSRSPAKGAGYKDGRRVKALPKGTTGIPGKKLAKENAVTTLGKSKLAAKPGAPATPVAHAKGRRGKAARKGGALVTTRARSGPTDANDYDVASNRNAATEEALVSLAKASRVSSNNIIWTDNITDGKKSVEKLLYSNGFAMAPKTQSGILPSQAMNLNASLAYNRTLRQDVQAETIEVEYLVYGTEEQLVKLQKQLQQDVQVTQVVSQLAQPHYNKALTKEQKPAPAKPAELAKAVAPDAPAKPAASIAPVEPAKTTTLSPVCIKPTPAAAPVTPAKTTAPAKPTPAKPVAAKTAEPVELEAKVESRPKSKSAREGESAKAETQQEAATEEKRHTADVPSPTKAAKAIKTTLSDDDLDEPREKQKASQKRSPKKLAESAGQKAPVKSDSKKADKKPSRPVEGISSTEQNQSYRKSRVEQAKQADLNQKQTSQPTRVARRQQAQQAQRVQAMLITLRFRRRVQMNAVQMRAIEQAERKCNILRSTPQAKNAKEATNEAAK
ncbi:MAG: zf-HC2 domain-containing protein [Phycisphaerae bacterium]|nr:zf-HC2 domain-containing protein [Phycisphaerae bacterium]